MFTLFGTSLLTACLQLDIAKASNSYPNSPKGHIIFV